MHTRLIFFSPLSPVPFLFKYFNLEESYFLFPSKQKRKGGPENQNTNRQVVIHLRLAFLFFFFFYYFVNNFRLFKKKTVFTQEQVTNEGQANNCLTITVEIYTDPLFFLKRKENIRKVTFVFVCACV
jgi:hypothetical protein